jgi:hypothetical protein
MAEKQKTSHKVINPVESHHFPQQKYNQKSHSLQRRKQVHTSFLKEDVSIPSGRSKESIGAQTYMVPVVSSNHNNKKWKRMYHLKLPQKKQILFDWSGQMPPQQIVQAKAELHKPGYQRQLHQKDRCPTTTRSNGITRCKGSRQVSPELDSSQASPNNGRRPRMDPNKAPNMEAGKETGNGTKGQAI